VRQILIVTLLILFSAVSAVAGMYRYTDSRGEEHFVDDLGSVPKKYRAKARSLDDLPPLNVMDATPAAQPRKKSADPVRESRQPERFTGTVELYVTSWCGYCRKAERYLNQKGIPYMAYDIEKDEGAKRRYRELGGTGGVPLIQIGANQIKGFSPEAIDRYTGR
jgi:glutaredoxin-like YruB-family protein